MQRVNTNYQTNYQIRSYQPKDEAQAIALWNHTLQEDPIDRENFYNRIICDVNFNPACYLVAEENNRLIGFIYGTKRKVPCEAAGLQPDNAWVVAMGVCPRYRRQGIGKALLANVEGVLTHMGAKTIDLGPYATNYFFPGVDVDAYKEAINFFVAQGYNSTSQCSSMDLNLRGYRYPEKYLQRKTTLEAQDYRFGSLKLEDTLAVFEFLNQHFPYWVPNVRENILQGRGEETIQLAWHGQEVVGFAMRAMDGTPGRFGPFGIASTQQGVGLGAILFHNLVSDMVARRIFYTWFLWTGGRNLDIYGTWGMEIYRTYAMMRKDM